MRILGALLLASSLLTGTTVAAQAEVKVVASVKPVHSLVAAVMNGVGTPDIILEGAGSPHDFALKPSQAQMLENADVVFWVGHVLEAFLEKPLETVGAKAKSVELIDAHELIKVGFREGGAFEKHDDDQGHESGHDDGHDEHDHEKKEASAYHDGHDNEEFDAHIWLDPMNAKAIVHEITEALVAADPENTGKYETNAEATVAKLDDLIAEVSAELEPIKNKGFVVFHDAYQYFENRFGLTALGSITVSPEAIPGAKRVTDIQNKIRELDVVCVFSEPQFEPKLVATVTEGTSAKTGVIDPLGADLENGPELYFELIRNMARAMKSCLSAAG